MKSSRCNTTPERTLIVLVPELEALLREATARPGLIQSMLSGGRERPLDREALHGELVIGAPIAPAPLTRRIDCPGDANACWMRADPVELTPDLAAVWLQAGARLESGPIQSELVEMLAAEGRALDFPVAERGYLRLDKVPECRFFPPWTLAGESMERVLPEGSGARVWRRLLNETQVMLHQRRQADPDTPGIPASLWFWGAGRLPESASVQPRVRCIVSGDPILAGLADWLGLEHADDVSDDAAPEPGTLHEWVAEPARSADDNLERLLQFLRPAWRSLRSGRLRRLELASLRHARSFSPADAWRVWR